MDKPKLNYNSPDWGNLKAALEQELNALHRGLSTQGMDPAKTEFLRGKVSLIRTILAWETPTL